MITVTSVNVGRYLELPIAIRSRTDLEKRLEKFQ